MLEVFFLNLEKKVGKALLAETVKSKRDAVKIMLQLLSK